MKFTQKIAIFVLAIGLVHASIEGRTDPYIQYIEKAFPLSDTFGILYFDEHENKSKIAIKKAGEDNAKPLTEEMIRNMSLEDVVKIHFLLILHRTSFSDKIPAFYETKIKERLETRKNGFLRELMSKELAERKSFTDAYLFSFNIEFENNDYVQIVCSFDLTDFTIKVTKVRDKSGEELDTAGPFDIVLLRSMKADKVGETTLYNLYKTLSTITAWIARVTIDLQRFYGIDMSSKHNAIGAQIETINTQYQEAYNSLRFKKMRQEDELKRKQVEQQTNPLPKAPEEG